MILNPNYISFYCRKNTAYYNNVLVSQKLLKEKFQTITEYPDCSAVEILFQHTNK